MSTLLLLAYVTAGSVLRLVVDPGGTDLLDSTSIPWWAQATLNVSTLGALVAFFVWQNRQIQRGTWYPAPIVVRMLEEKDKTIADKDKQIAGQALLIEEQNKTIRASESTADLTAKALVQATSNQGWVDILVQRALGGSALSPSSGDNAREEVGT